MKIDLNMVFVSADINLRDYTYAQYNGKGTKTFNKGGKSFKLKTGGYFAYRESKTKNFFVFPGMLDVEFGLDHSKTDKLFEKCDEPKLKRTELTRMFKNPEEEKPAKKTKKVKEEKVKKSAKVKATEPKVKEDEESSKPNRILLITFSSLPTTGRWNYQIENSVNNNYNRSDYKFDSIETALKAALKDVKAKRFTIEFYDKKFKLQKFDTTKSQALADLKEVISKNPVRSEREEFYLRYAQVMNSRYEAVQALRACAPMSEADYKNDPILGYHIRTGRASSTTAQAVVVGFSTFKSKMAIATITPNTGRLLYWPLQSSLRSDQMVDAARDKVKLLSIGKRCSYNEYLKFLDEATGKKTALQEKAKETAKTAYEVMNKFFSDFVGKQGKCQALIQFSDGTSWKPVVEIKHDKGVGILGSGSKLRWIGWQFVKDMKDLDGDRVVTRRPSVPRFRW